jgi:peptidoglycan biosynthesis protein MviN/MurJ (putative lipid II flippase)
VAAGANVAILLGTLRRREGRLGGRKIAQSLSRIAAASAIMGAALVLADRALEPAALRGLPAAAVLAGLIAGGAGVYWACAHLLGAPEPSELRRMTRRRR